MFNRAMLTNPRTLALTGVMTAVIFVMTSIIKIPTGAAGGYIHFGDAGVLFTGFAFGPVVGMVASGLGTALADMAGGYAQWWIYSLIIHGLMGLTAGYLVGGKSELRRLLAASGVSGVILIIGYLIAGTILSGFGVAITEVPLNLVQIAVGAVVAIPLFFAVLRAYPPLVWHPASED